MTILGGSPNSAGNDCTCCGPDELTVIYYWEQDDLDTVTTFCGASTGYACAGGPYMTYTGDDTGQRMYEKTVIDIGRAKADRAWTSSTTIICRADTWGGSPGAASIEVTYRGRTETRDCSYGPSTGIGCNPNMTWIADIIVNADGTWRW